MTPIFTIIFFVFGLIIGSFLNVVIYRFNTRGSFFGSFGGRSACMSCQRRLPWYELIPVVSFFVLRGRCKSCKTKISIQYLLVELATGLVFILLFLKFKDVFFENSSVFAITYGYYAFMFSLLLVVAVYDLRHKIIPDILSFVFGILSFIGLFFFHGNGLFAQIGFYFVPSFYWHIPSVLEFLSGILIAFPFAFFWLVSSGRWMGLGDAKLALGIGWLLGISMALSSLAIAFWVGAIIGICLVVLSKKNRINGMRMKSEIPFAPFLVFGTFFAFLFGLNFFGI